MNKVELTEKMIAEKLKPRDSQYTTWDVNVPGFGVRVSPGGRKSYIWQGRVNGEQVKVSIGRAGMSKLKAARAKAKEIAVNADKGNDPRTRRNNTDTDTSFGALMTAYVESLKGRASYYDVKRAVESDIKTPFPYLWKKQATLITDDDCLRPVARLADEGKYNYGDKIRVYIKAAYNACIRSKGDAKALKTLRDFRAAAKVTKNPAIDLACINPRNARERALSLAEFRAYWNRVDSLPEPKRSLAMLHVLTGGQRQEQLQRATLRDIDSDGPTLVLLDGKGKGRAANPRKHVVPLLPEAMRCIETLTLGGEHIFSLDGGLNPADHTTIGKRIVKPICKVMDEAGELEGTSFTAGTIRATIETRLAAAPYRVGKDIRGQLQSHGLSGIQDKHYDHHQYIEEKTEALEKLWRMLNSIPEPEETQKELLKLLSQFEDPKKALEMLKQTNAEE